MDFGEDVSKEEEGFLWLIKRIGGWRRSENDWFAPGFQQKTPRHLTVTKKYFLPLFPKNRSFLPLFFQKLFAGSCWRGEGKGNSMPAVTPKLQKANCLQQFIKIKSVYKVFPKRNHPSCSKPVVQPKTLANLRPKQHLSGTPFAVPNSFRIYRQKSKILQTYSTGVKKCTF